MGTRSPRLSSQSYPALLFGAIFLSFWPALGGSFLGWDDRLTILENPHIRSWSLENIRWFWTTFHMGPYQPLSWMSLAADYSLWGGHPAGFHATNLLLHAAAASLLYLILLKITQSPFRSLVGTLLYAIHPLRVESVAWVTERRDVLSGLFFMAAWLAYLRGARWGALLFFLAATLSKATAIGLIWLLVLSDHFVLEEKKWSEKWPFLIIAAGIGFVGCMGARQEGFFVHAYSLAQRVGLFAYGITFYVQKTLVPWHLSPLYSLPIQMSSMTGEFFLRTAGVMALTGWLFIRRTRDPLPFWAWAASVLILLPVSGIAQNGRQLAADRYTYLASVPWAWVVAQKIPETRFWRVVASSVVILLMGLTWNQCHYWKNDRMLWERAVALEPENRTAHYNLGTQLMISDPPAALRELEKVLALDPGAGDAHYNVGVLYQSFGQWDRARQHYKECIRLKPDWVQPMNNLAVVLIAMKDFTGAAQVLDRALALDDHFAEARFNRGVLYMMRGKRDLAQNDFSRAVKDDPTLQPRLEAMHQVK